jgi:hypothetical protein
MFRIKFVIVCSLIELGLFHATVLLNAVGAIHECEYPKDLRSYIYVMLSP